MNQLNAKNKFYTADCLYVLSGLNSESVDLIYLDPPFNSKRIYSAPVGSKAAGASFKDMWTWQDVDEAYLERMVSDYPLLVRYIMAIKETHSQAMMSYVTYMTQRIIEMHRVLKSTGSLYLHCDQTASHYLKIICDRVFGKGNFRNEIIWCYSTSGRSKKKFAAKHDVILFYSKSKDYYWGDYRIPVSDEYLKSHYKQRDEEGRVCRVREDAGKVRVYYPEEGMICNDWWQMPYVNSQSKERIGYPTQKPLSLLTRIIKASSNEGDVVLDPFAGCATTCVAAQQLKRNWIGVDIEGKAAELVVERLSDDAGLFKDFVHLTTIPQRTDIKEEEPTANVKDKLYKEQNGRCNGCNTAFEKRHFDIDHIVPKAKGGGNYYENYQLLCGNCNKIKGDRPMEYLRVKIKAREDMMKAQITFGE